MPRQDGPEMRPAASSTVSILVTLERGAALPLHRQLYEQVRQAVLDGRLAPGTRVPSTRVLAADLGISRNTVLNAFDQLVAEGYLEGTRAAGTAVPPHLPDGIGDRARSTATPPGTTRPAGRRSAGARGTVLTHLPATPPPLLGGPRGERHAFRVGIPALDAFPARVWGRLLARRWRASHRDLLSYKNPAGYLPLREAIADYLGAARAVRCTADQVIIVAGSQQGLDLAARVLLDPGDAVWMEDPGYLGARGALTAAGALLVPVPIDGEGLDVGAGIARQPDARLAYLTPSHHFAVGVTMSLARRLALLEWASGAGAWVLEDDYASEYRYTGRPLAALQGLDADGRVIYMGTFSKVICPALRLGYVVVPADLVDLFVAARQFADNHSPALEQAVLADFIVEGHFARHIRRMRSLYLERQVALIAALHDHLPELQVKPHAAGMHLVGWLPTKVDDQEAARLAAARGIDVWPLSLHSLAPVERGALLLGYAAVPAEQMRRETARLATALRAIW